MDAALDKAMIAYLDVACRALLASVFAVSAGAKLRNRGAFRKFRSWLQALPLPISHRRNGIVAAAITGAEVSIVVLTALPWTARAGFVLAAATLTVFVVGTVAAIRAGSTASCECFGTSGAPLAPHHVVRDAALLCVAVAGAITAGADGARSAGIAVSVAAALVVAIVVVFLDDLLSIFGTWPGAEADARPARP